jgi:hypothetical protein
VKGGEWACHRSEIVENLNKEINAALADPTMKGRFADLDTEPMPMTRADFGKFVAGGIEKGARWFGQQISRPGSGNPLTPIPVLGIGRVS